MGLKSNNMPVSRKKIKDKSNLQIRGRAGQGKKRSKGREQKMEAKYRGDVPIRQAMSEDKVNARISFVELSKLQETKTQKDDHIEHVESDVEETAKKKTKKKRRKQQPCTESQKMDQPLQEDEEDLDSSMGCPQNQRGSRPVAVEFGEDGSSRKRTVHGKPAPDSQNETLHYGARVCLTGLKGSADLNGKVGTCLSWDESKKRWYVRLGDPAISKLLNVKTENLKVLVLQQGSTARVQGLCKAPELNGKIGVCRSWNGVKERWLVALAGGVEKLLKPDNLEVCSVEGELHVSPTISQQVCVCSEKAKPEELVQFIKKIREDDKRGLRMISLMIVYCCREHVQAVAGILAQAQLQCVSLHKDQSSQKGQRARSEFNLDGKRILVTSDDVDICTKHVGYVIHYDFPMSLKLYCNRLSLVQDTGVAWSLFTKGSAALANDFAALLERSHGTVPPGLRDLASQMS